MYTKKRNIIVVTGGSGFIGTNLVEFYRLRDDCEVFNLDCKKPLNPLHTKFWIYTDILDKDQLENNILNINPTHVIHLAARTDLDGHTIQDYSTNVDGVDNLLQSIRNLKNLKRVGFASTRLVCRIGYNPIDEFDVCPSTFYGMSKVAGETLVREKIDNFCEYFIFRPTSIWGEWFDVPYRNFFENIYKGRYLHPKGFKIFKSFGYVGNSVYQIDKLLFADAGSVVGKTFYLCDYDPIELKEWGNVIAEHMKKKDISEVPYLALRFFATIGDLFKTLGMKNPPLTSFRLNNLITNMTYETEQLRTVCGDLPFSLRDSVRRTVLWMEQCREHSHHERNSK